MVSPSSRCSSAAAGEALVDLTSSSSSSSSSSDSGADDAAGTSGLLSSQVTELTGCGTADWPWLIEARDGQRINITLHDFSREALASGHLGSGAWAGFAKQQSRTCKVYATIRDGSVGRSTTICGDQAPATHVFLSTTRRVEIRLLQPAAAKLTSKVKATSPDLQTSYFLLRYQGFILTLVFFMPQPLIGGGIKRCFHLTSDICLSRTSGLSREQRGLGIMTKIGTGVAHVARDSDTTFKVKRSKVKVARPLYSPRPQRVRQLQR